MLAGTTTQEEAQSGTAERKKKYNRIQVQQTA
jgi:hypothetical protein